MSNSHEIAKNLANKMLHHGWLISNSVNDNGFEEFEQFVQQVLAYELSEVPADFESEPELQFP
jgi:hypothetical protein